EDDVNKALKAAEELKRAEEAKQKEQSEKQRLKEVIEENEPKVSVALNDAPIPVNTASMPDKVVMPLKYTIFATNEQHELLKQFLQNNDIDFVEEVELPF